VSYCIEHFIKHGRTGGGERGVEVPAPNYSWPDHPKIDFKKERKAD